MKWVIELTEQGEFFVNRENISFGDITSAILFSELEKTEIEKRDEGKDSFTYYPMYIGNEILVADVMDELDSAYGYSFGDSEDDFNEELEDIQYTYKDLFDEVINDSTTYGEVVTKIVERIKEDIEADE